MIYCRDTIHHLHPSHGSWSYGQLYCLKTPSVILNKYLKPPILSYDASVHNQSERILGKG